MSKADNCCEQDGWPNYSMSGTLTASWTPVDSALNPAWRSTVVNLITTLDYDDSFPRDLKTAMNNDITHNKLSALKQLDPNSGAYFNEVSHIFSSLPSYPLGIQLTLCLQGRPKRARLAVGFLRGALRSTVRYQAEIRPVRPALV